MDRFIVFRKSRRCSLLFHLKSNMDRFIGGPHSQENQKFFYLKSNMDRFIDEGLIMLEMSGQFKIQYG